MTFVSELAAAIEDKHLLKHSFYQAWMEGCLSLDQLRHYAHQYTPFVDAFPRLVSGVHNQCEDATARRHLLMNLMDEEGNSEATAHPQLWRNFAAGLGESAEAPIGPKATAMKETFLQLSRSSYEEGLCALYAYEYQIPQIAELKIKGLKENYQVDSTQTLEFFDVHQRADVYHSEACADLINQIPEEKRPQALRAARQASEALWDFLTEVHGA